MISSVVNIWPRSQYAVRPAISQTPVLRWMVDNQAGGRYRNLRSLKVDEALYMRMSLSVSRMSELSWGDGLKRSFHLKEEFNYVL